MLALLIGSYPVAAWSDGHGNAQDINSRLSGWQAERIDVNWLPVPLSKKAQFVTMKGIIDFIPGNAKCY